MKRFFILILGGSLCWNIAQAQRRVVDVMDDTPVSSATIFDAQGNVAGFTTSEGDFSNIPDSEYPITIRCIGYENIILEHPVDTVLQMIPAIYELDEAVISASRDVMKQTFYVRESFSMYNETDTVTYFTEHMADRFIPASKDAKFSGKSSLRILESRPYEHYQLFGEDSVSTNPELLFPSMATMFEPIDKEVVVPESFKKQETATKLYEKPGKSGMELIIKQNDQIFTFNVDALADTKDHMISPWPLKLLGFTMEINQVYVTQVYRANDKGIYLPKDLLESSYVIQADGRGKFLRKALKSDKPIVIRCMVEMYVVDRDYLSKEEAKDEYKNKPKDVKFVIPSTVPPLNEATRRLVERAKAEAKNQK